MEAEASAGAAADGGSHGPVPEGSPRQEGGASPAAETGSAGAAAGASAGTAQRAQRVRREVLCRPAAAGRGHTGYLTFARRVVPSVQSAAVE